MVPVVNEIILGIVIFVASPEYRLAPELPAVIHTEQFHGPTDCVEHIDAVISQVRDDSGALDRDDDGHAFGERVLVAVCMLTEEGSYVRNDGDRFLLVKPTGEYRILPPLELQAK